MRLVYHLRPRILSFARGQIERRLDAELAALDAMGGPCERAVQAFDAAKAAWKAAPRDLKPALNCAMDRASDEVTRMGRRVLAMESRIEPTRAELERAGAGFPDRPLNLSRRTTP